MKNKIVILDGQLTSQNDLSWDSLKEYGDLFVYDSTKDDEIIKRSEEAEILIVNKVKLDKSHFNQLPRLKLICLIATGYDNINIADARSAGIMVCNAVGYGIHSVAQHVFALLLSVYNHVDIHNHSVHNGEWTGRQWSYSLKPSRELAGKIIGIYGFGKIGKRVAQIALAFGMQVISKHKHPDRDAIVGVSFVSMKELFQKSDVISLHAPLSTENKKIVNQGLLSLLKPNAVLINTGRGGLINENDLRNFLLSREDVTAALDVLSTEPPPENHPLIGLNNCIITPHHAWATREARNRLISSASKNIKGYLEGNPMNEVS